MSVQCKSCSVLLNYAAPWRRGITPLVVPIHRSADFCLNCWEGLNEKIAAQTIIEAAAPKPAAKTKRKTGRPPARLG